MIRPGGYSSEDNSDYDDYYYNDTPKVIKKRELTDEEKAEAQKDELYRCACYGNTNEVLHFLDEGFKIDTDLRDGWSLLLLASSTGRANLAIELINRGADINQARDKMTVLMSACSCPVTTSPFEQSVLIVKHLISCKVDVEAKSRKKMSALMFAASAGNYEAVNILLPLCNKHDEDGQGWTALFWAINDKHLQIVQLLIEAGLDCKKMDVRGLKPLDYAKQNDHQEIVDLLPDPDKEKNAYVFANTFYQYYELVDNPCFLHDILLILQGVKCHNLMKLFDQSKIDLVSFLTLTRSDLMNLGVFKPYQQNRILGGLFRFHKHNYKHKSVPIVSRDEIYTTIDTAKALVAAIRQFMAMQASITYLKLNLDDLSNENQFLKRLKEIDVRIKKMQYNLIKLRDRSEKWDKFNEPVDLICYEKPKRFTFWYATISLLMIIPAYFLVKSKQV